MKRFLLFSIVSLLLALCVFSASAEFIIDPSSWMPADIPDTVFSIKLPLSFKTISIKNEASDIIMRAGDDDLEFRAVDLGKTENLTDMADTLCSWDADSFWEASVNSIPVVGFISSEDNVYGVLLLDDSGSAIELDFIVSEDPERNARAVNKASLMLETLTQKIS